MCQLYLGIALNRLAASNQASAGIIMNVCRLLIISGLHIVLFSANDEEV